MHKLPLSIRKALLPVLYPVRNLLHPRAFQTYAVGFPRTGTHSLAHIFAHSYRSLHEPQSDWVNDLIYAYEIESLSEATIAEMLAQRDRSLWLEMESSHMITPFVPILARLFPDARFVVLMRDAYTWLHSTLNIHLPLAKPEGLPNRRLRKTWIARYGYERVPHQVGDAVLKARGLPPVTGYLMHWQDMYTRAFTQLPPERRLTVYTREISASLEKLADFLGVKAKTLETEQTHIDPKSEKSTLFYEIDRDYLEEQVQLHCGALMAQHFPTIRSMEDAFRRG